MIWRSLTVGACVLLECPGRWYLGVVRERDNATVTLGRALCLHLISDLGVFLSGRVPPGTEATPLPGGVEVNLAVIETAEPYPISALDAVRVRTHPERTE